MNRQQQWSRISYGRGLLALLLILVVSSEISTISTPSPIYTRNVIESLGYIKSRTAEIMLIVSANADWRPSQTADFNREMAEVRKRGQQIAAAFSLIRAAIDDYSTITGDDDGVAEISRASKSMANATGRAYSLQVMRLAATKNARVAPDGRVEFAKDEDSKRYENATSDLQTAISAARSVEILISDWVSKRIPAD